MRAIQTHSQPKMIAYHWLDPQQLPKFGVLQVEEMLREILTIAATHTEATVCLSRHHDNPPTSIEKTMTNRWQRLPERESHFSGRRRSS
jgi:hypothetical protein